MLLTIIIFVILAVIAVAMFKYSSNPKFCKSCHVMEPYYKSWKKSSHKAIPCVDCHLEPGLINTFKGKWLAIKQIATVLTGTYGSKIYAKISDVSCLRSGCHSEKSLSGKIKSSRYNMLFNHDTHLSQMRHGIKLSCTSCHSQTIISSHINVTVSACFLCHFKREAEKTSTGSCSICHDTPDTSIIKGQYTIIHNDFLKNDIECMRCHVDVKSGSGNATKDKCYNCHNQPEKIDKFNDTEFIHINHVTAHKVDCGRCHNEIAHKFNTELAKTQHEMCSSCHIKTHFSQSLFYAGIGGKGVTGEPDPMHTFGISCSGCHTDRKLNDETHIAIKGQTFTSSALVCTSCHREKYTKFVSSFNSELTKMIEYIQVKTKTSASLQDIQTDQTTRKLIKECEFNLDYVKTVKGIHNPFYAIQLLKVCDKNLEGIPDLNDEEMKLQKPEGFLEYNCGICHSHLEVQMPPDKVKFKGKEMSHKDHAELDLNCSFCHKFGRHKEALIKDLKACSKCHENDFKD